MPNDAYPPVAFKGPCAFLLCKLQGPHEHLRCQNCGAVRHGNVSTCYWCATQRKSDLWLQAQLDTIRK